MNGFYDQRFMVSQKPFCALGQLDQGPDLVIASVPSITSIEDLKGKTLMVDSGTSGYAYLLRKVLSLYGLTLGTDYAFQVGQTLKRSIMPNSY